MYNLAIFASGAGSNAAEMIRFFNESGATENRLGKVVLVASNRADAGVLEIAKSAEVASWVFDRKTWNNPDFVLEYLEKQNIDFIVLAGFLWKIPAKICAAFPNKITNIHPSLLPKYGGKGMFGANVHQAVLENKETKSGMTIHYVNENYDEGNIIWQASCDVYTTDTVQTLSKRIQILELTHYKYVVNKVLAKK